MGKLSLNKSVLNKEKRNLKIFNRYLPALELKRQQLMLERRKLREQLHALEQQLEALLKRVGEEIPMIAHEKTDLDNLVRVVNVLTAKKNIVGVNVPVLKDIIIETEPYSFLMQPHWIDNLVERLKQVLKLKVEVYICKKSYHLIDHATRVTTQRVNFFSKILIPRAEKNIAKIKIFLSDQDRAGVVNAKISKSKLEAANSV